MHERPELDGFHTVSGIAAIVAGPVMLMAGAPAGWAFLIMSAGAVVLLAQWAILAEVTFREPDASTMALGAVGVVCVAIAVIYLTRAANDLPSAFPGFDPHSENFQLIPGCLTLTVGLVALARMLAGVHPTRPHHRRNGS